MLTESNSIVNRTENRLGPTKTKDIIPEEFNNEICDNGDYRIKSKRSDNEASHEIRPLELGRRERVDSVEILEKFKHDLLDVTMKSPDVSSVDCLLPLDKRRPLQSQKC